MLIGMCSWIALIRILSTFGSNVLAGYTIGIRVIIFALLPAAGVANAAATMVGQALGAKKPERAEHAVKVAGTYNMVVLRRSAACSRCSRRRSRGCSRTIRSSCRSRRMRLRIVACGFPFYAWGMVISQSFNGAGDTRTPTLLNLFVFWCWEIPLAYVLAKVLGMGPNGIYLAIAIAFSTYAIGGRTMFRRGTGRRSGSEVIPSAAEGSARHGLLAVPLASLAMTATAASSIAFAGAACRCGGRLRRTLERIDRHLRGVSCRCCQRIRPRLRR